MEETTSIINYTISVQKSDQIKPKTVPLYNLTITWATLSIFDLLLNSFGVGSCHSKLYSLCHSKHWVTKWWSFRRSDKLIVYCEKKLVLVFIHPSKFQYALEITDSQKNWTRKTNVFFTTEQEKIARKHTICFCPNLILHLIKPFPN